MEQENRSTESSGNVASGRGDDLRAQAGAYRAPHESSELADASPAAGLSPSSGDAWSGTRMMVALAGSAVLLLAMRSAAGVVAPIVLALVVAVGIAPAIGWLERRGLRTSLAFAVTVTVTLFVEIVVILLLSASLASFALSLPDYEEAFQRLWDSVVASLTAAGIDVEALLSFESIDFKKLVEIGLNLLASITGLFSTLLLVTFTAAFMLLETTTISRKTDISGVSEATRGRVQRLASALRGFVKVSALLGAVVAVVETVLLLILGVPNALLWGLLSFFFSFIPYIGFVLALVPPALLGLLTGGWSTLLIVLLGYVLINTASDNFVKPKVMGASTNLSPLAVFLSLIVFGWALGPLGGLLAVPMLLIVKVLLFDAYPEWRFLAALLGSVPEQRDAEE